MTAECACLIQVDRKIVYLRVVCALSYIQEKKKKLPTILWITPLFPIMQPLDKLEFV